MATHQHQHQHQHHHPMTMPTIISMRPALKTFTSSRQVRTKFFHRIGIISPTPPHAINNNGNKASAAIKSAGGGILRNVPRFREPLRKSYGGQQQQHQQHHRQHQHQHQQHRVKAKPRPMAQSEEKKRVGFRENVTVVPIPMRGEYSDRIRTKLWRRSGEMNQMLERNIIEFASEDYNWRNACQEEEMYFCNDSRELVHPVHVELGHYTFGTGGSCQRSDSL